MEREFRRPHEHQGPDRGSAGTPSASDAGKSNGGSPDFFVGVEIVGITDFTRSSEPYAALPNPLPFPRETAAILDAHVALSALGPALLKPHAPVGFYLIGDAA